MATTALSGKAGSAVATGGGGTIPAEVTSWDATIETDLLDAASFDSAGWKEFVAGLQGATGSLTAIGGLPAIGSVTSLTLQTSTESGSLEITGAAFINASSVSTPVEGRVEYTGTFTYTGAVTIGTVT
jgi:hypothetical protein